jgi:hypothetical protein
MRRTSRISSGSVDTATPFGGGDPAALIDHSRSDPPCVKGCSPAVAARACEAGTIYRDPARRVLRGGTGQVDFGNWPACARALRTGWIVVEQDVLPSMGAPVEARRAPPDFSLAWV